MCAGHRIYRESLYPFIDSGQYSLVYKERGRHTDRVSWLKYNTLWATSVYEADAEMDSVSSMDNSQCRPTECNICGQPVCTECNMNQNIGSMPATPARADSDLNSFDDYYKMSRRADGRLACCHRVTVTDKHKLDYMLKYSYRQSQVYEEFNCRLLHFYTNCKSPICHTNWNSTICHTNCKTPICHTAHFSL